jgi:hypothetical protein
VEKKFFKKSKMVAQTIFFNPDAILDFLKNFFFTKFEKMLDTLYVKNFDFDPPFWIEPPFLTYLTKNALDSCC